MELHLKVDPSIFKRIQSGEQEDIYLPITGKRLIELINLRNGKWKEFDSVTVKAKAGDVNLTMRFNHLATILGTGVSDWGYSPKRVYFIIKLGGTI